MPIRLVTIRRWLIAASITSIVAAGSMFLVAQANGEDETRNLHQHSAFTREELRRNWTHAERFPLLVPARAPRGAGQAPEVGFALDNVVVDPAQRPSRRVWVSYYLSDRFGEGASFRVYQRPEDLEVDKPCGPEADLPFVQRHVGNALVTVCSSKLNRGSAARTYWRDVALTSDLARVDWIAG